VAKQKWTKIADNKIQMIWKCSECANQVSIPPTFYENNGTPICDGNGCGGEDMVYVRTEILK